jgi:hypothetical protein
VLAIEDWRECEFRKTGEIFRGACWGEGPKKEEKRRSNGCKAPGRCTRDVESREAGLLLPGEETMESYVYFRFGLRSAHAP